MSIRTPSRRRALLLAAAATTGLVAVALPPAASAAPAPAAAASCTWTTVPASGTSQAVETRPSTSVLTPLRSPFASGGSLDHFSSATAGNYIVGRYVIPNSSGATAPIIWTSSSPRLLGTSSSGQARDVNATGTVVGVVSGAPTALPAGFPPSGGRPPPWR